MIVIPKMVDEQFDYFQTTKFPNQILASSYVNGRRADLCYHELYYNGERYDYFQFTKFLIKNRNKITNMCYWHEPRYEDGSNEKYICLCIANVTELDKRFRETISIEQVKHEFDSSGKSFYADVCDYFVSIDSEPKGHFQKLITFVPELFKTNRAWLAKYPSPKFNADALTIHTRQYDYIIKVKDEEQFRILTAKAKFLEGK